MPDPSSKNVLRAQKKAARRESKARIAAARRRRLKEGERSLQEHLHGRVLRVTVLSLRKQRLFAVCADGPTSHEEG